MKTLPKNRKPATPLPPEFPCTVETFNRITKYSRDNLVNEKPSCWNGIVSFRRYRITFEEIEEPVDVLAERLRKLWRECNNMHHFGPLKDAANSIGIELKSSELGKERKRTP